MSTAETFVVPHRPHSAARPVWIVYGTGLPGLTDDPRSEGPAQLATCHDQTVAHVLATALRQMSPTYLDSLIPKEPF